MFVETAPRPAPQSIVSPMSTIDWHIDAETQAVILDDAARVVERRGWTRMPDGGRGPTCVMYAMFTAAEARLGWIPTPGSAWSVLTDDLRRSIGHNSPATWNDDECADGAEAAEALRRAARQVRAAC